MVRKRLKSDSEVWIVDETNDFGLDFVEVTERGFRSITPRHGSSNLEKDEFGIYKYSLAENVRKSHGLLIGSRVFEEHA